MKEKKTACYARISTLIHGQCLDNQLSPIRQFCNDREFSLVREYTDEGVSGSVDRRPGLDEMLSQARMGKFNYLIVMEFSRLARDVRHLLNLLHELEQIGVTVISIREGFQGDTAMGKAMIAMIGIFSTVEKDLLKERIKSALATKKADAERRGERFNIGRPIKLTDEMIGRAHKLRATGESIRGIAQVLGIAKSTAQRALKMSQKSPLKSKAKCVPNNVSKSDTDKQMLKGPLNE